jgi:hypothetical protein
MPYAGFDDVFKRFPAIKTMVGTGVSDVETLDVASVYVAGAEGVVDAYLASRYVVPLATSPLITKITCDIAIYDLGVDRMPRIPEWMQKRYDMSIQLLEKLRDGDMLLNPQSYTTVTTGDNEAWSSTASYHPVFSPVLKDIEQSEDRDFVDYERDARSSDIGTP